MKGFTSSIIIFLATTKVLGEMSVSVLGELSGEDEMPELGDMSDLGEMMEPIPMDYDDPMSDDKKNLLNGGNKGKYTTKEEIQKAPSEDHPCELTRTSIQITFPDMKQETFVNLLGYREPNIVHLMRCKGQCDEGGTTIKQIGCIPTKVRQKTVKMMVKTQLSGREPRQRYKDMVLEEHVECGCQCKQISMMACLGGFNNQTCECECEERHYGKERLRCELMRNTYWDATSCQCRSKSISPRGVEQIPGSSDCANSVLDQLINSPASVQSSPTRVEIVSLILLGCFITVSIFLAASTVYYRKKVSRAKNKPTKSNNNSHHSRSHDRSQRPDIPPKPSKSSKSRHKNEEMPREIIHSPPHQMQATVGTHHSQQQVVFAPVFSEHVVMDDILMMGGDTCDKYDEHGVKIDYQYN